jgi:hypothetical protein
MISSPWTNLKLAKNRIDDAIDRAAADRLAASAAPKPAVRPARRRAIATFATALAVIGAAIRPV